MKSNKKKLWKNIGTITVLLIGNLVFFLTIWLSNKYDKVSIDQFVYQIKAPSKGTEFNLMTSAYIGVGLYGILATGLEVLIYLLCSGFFSKKFANSEKYQKFCNLKFCRFIASHGLSLSVWVLVLSLCFFILKHDVLHYVDSITTDSDLIERHYVDPNSVDLTFPEKKRNLIYIMLESMEVTYSDTDAGAPITQNYMPELTKLAQDNINFSNDDGIGGALSFAGTTWTAASMVSQTSGVIVQVPLTGENYGGQNKYIPGLVSIGEVLEKEGYKQVLLLGSNAAFAGRDTYFTEHGNYEIVDLIELKAQERLPQDYREFWGFEDEKLIQFAKEELTRLAASEEPFNFTMLTCDTHFPDGYKCRLCSDEHEEQYSNVISCSSKQIYSFVQWIQEQDFYEDTTIVLCGDHLTMDPIYLRDVNEEYQRTIYNCIINSAVTPAQEKNRQFGTFDMFPTTLAAMGVKIEGDRLGLGTNLFSTEETLTERYSYSILNEELQKNSTFYNEKFLLIKTKED